MYAWEIALASGHTVRASSFMTESAALGCHTRVYTNAYLSSLDVIYTKVHTLASLVDHYGLVFKGSQDPWDVSVSPELPELMSGMMAPGARYHFNATLWEEIKSSVYNCMASVVLSSGTYVIFSDHLFATKHGPDGVENSTYSFVSWLIHKKKIPCVQMPLVMNKNYYWNKGTSTGNGDSPPHTDLLWVFMPTDSNMPHRKALDTLKVFNCEDSKDTLEAMKEMLSKTRKMNEEWICPPVDWDGIAGKVLAIHGFVDPSVALQKVNQKQEEVQPYAKPRRSFSHVAQAIYRRAR